MALIDKLEFCHCDLNRNLNELVRAARGATDAEEFGCGEVRPERRQEAERYAKAPEAWLGLSCAAPEIADQSQTVSSLLGSRNGIKDELVSHLIRRLRDNVYTFYAVEDEDLETPESGIQHLEICCFNWEQNLLILLDEIGKGTRTYGWHGVGRFRPCGDINPNNNYPRMIEAMLASVVPQDEVLFTQLRAKLEEAYPEN